MIPTVADAPTAHRVRARVRAICLIRLAGERQRDLQRRQSGLAAQSPALRLTEHHRRATCARFAVSSILAAEFRNDSR